MTVQHVRDVVTVDGWLNFRIAAKPATLVKHLRSQMESLLLKKIVSPNIDVTGSPEGKALIQAISTLVQKETKEVPDRNGADLVKSCSGAERSYDGGSQPRRGGGYMDQSTRGERDMERSGGRDSDQGRRGERDMERSGGRDSDQGRRGERDMERSGGRDSYQGRRGEQDRRGRGMGHNGGRDNARGGGGTGRSEQGQRGRNQGNEGRRY